jgi:uncharacterized protein with beta-barrel porin domain
VVNIAGHLALNAASTTVIEIQGAAVDKINAGGTAAVNGTLQLVALGGAYNFGVPYNFLTATGSVTGTFTTVTTDAAFGVGVTSTVTYNASNSFVTLNAAPLVIPPVVPPVVVPPVIVPPAPTLLGALRPLNVLAVASGMDRAVAGGVNPSAFFGVYNQPTTAALITAVNTLSGEVHTSTNAMGVQSSDQFMRVMLDLTAIGRDASLSATPIAVMALGEKGPRSTALFIGGRFDTELGSGTQTYAGSVNLRYAF